MKYARMSWAAALCWAIPFIFGCATAEDRWRDARRADSISAYQSFLRQYSDSEFHDQARTRLTKLRDDRYWQETESKDSIQGYESFLRRHPDSRFSSEAQLRLRQLKDHLERRYVDESPGSVRDTVTGLIWHRDDIAISEVVEKLDMSSGLSTKELETYVKGLRTGGFADWRIPTKSQFAALEELYRSGHMIGVFRPSVDWYLYRDGDYIVQYRARVEDGSVGVRPVRGTNTEGGGRNNIAEITSAPVGILVVCAVRRPKSIKQEARSEPDRNSVVAFGVSERAPRKQHAFVSVEVVGQGEGETSFDHSALVLKDSVGQRYLSCGAELLPPFSRPTFKPFDSAPFSWSFHPLSGNKMIAYEKSKEGESVRITFKGAGAGCVFYFEVRQERKGMSLTMPDGSNIALSPDWEIVPKSESDAASMPDTKNADKDPQSKAEDLSHLSVDELRRLVSDQIKSGRIDAERLRLMREHIHAHLRRVSAALDQVEKGGKEGWAYEVYADVITVVGTNATVVTREEWSQLIPAHKQQLREYVIATARHAQEVFNEIDSLIETALESKR